MTSTSRNARLCEACGRALDASQERFCTEMCRLTFQEVFADGSAHSYLFSDDDVLAAAEQEELEEHRRLSNRTDDDPPLGIALLDEEDEDDYDVLDDLDDDDDDDDVDADDDDVDFDSDGDDDDDDYVDDDLIDDEESGEDALPEAFALPVSPSAMALPSAPSNTPSKGGIQWERVPEMEAYVGVTIVRATCRVVSRSSYGVSIEILAELARIPAGPRKGGDSYLRLTAVADDAEGGFLGWMMANIPKWGEFPPLCIERISLNASAMPARLRLFPEVN